MKNKKLLTAIICIITVCALLVTVYAVTRYNYKSATGQSESLIINRVNITLEQTQFTFDKPLSDGILECRTKLIIEKTQPDFYGMLHSVTISGEKMQYVVFTAGKNNGDAVLPENVLLPVNEKGDTQPLEWDITFAVPYEESKSTYYISVDLYYTTGVKTNITQQYTTSIPVTVVISD